jgi:6-phosphofructokinase 1
LGVAAIEGLRQGQSRVMAGIINNKIVYTPIHEAVKNSTQLDLDLYRISKILAI